MEDMVQELIDSGILDLGEWEILHEAAMVSCCGDTVEWDCPTCPTCGAINPMSAYI